MTSGDDTRRQRLVRDKAARNIQAAIKVKAELVVLQTHKLMNSLTETTAGDSNIVTEEKALLASIQQLRNDVDQLQWLAAQPTDDDAELVQLEKNLVPSLTDVLHSLRDYLNTYGRLQTGRDEEFAENAAEGDSRELLSMRRRRRSSRDYETDLESNINRLIRTIEDCQSYFAALRKQMCLWPRPVHTSAKPAAAGSQPSTQIRKVTIPVVVGGAIIGVLICVPAGLLSAFVLGPFGLLLNAKIACAALVGGSTAGAIGGKLIGLFKRKRQEMK